jgi:dihydroneopterin aldolase
MLEIKLINIAVHARHGVLDEERRLGQPFYIDLHCHLAEGHRVRDDELSTTVDYSALFNLVRSIAEGQPCRLLETLAERIAKAVLEGFPLVAEVEIEVRKPAAPLGGVLDHAAVRLSLRR